MVAVKKKKDSRLEFFTLIHHGAATEISPVECGKEGLKLLVSIKTRWP